MTFAQWCDQARTRLVAAKLQCADPVLHSRQIAESALNLSTTQVLVRWQEPLSSAEEKSLNTFLERRLTGEPFQYISGYEWFWNSKFKVGPGTLIPRRETEHLVEETLKQGVGPFRIAELGAGTGNIGISILLERPNWEWVAFEKNPQAFPYAQVNATTLLSASHHYELVAGDFFTEIETRGLFDGIVSNPPYVAQGAMDELSKEVKSEPVMALVGGQAGWELPERLIQVSQAVLKPGGFFLSEIGHDQEIKIKEILQANGFEKVEVLPDLAGLPRIAKGVKSGRASY